MSLAAIDWALRDPKVQSTVFGPARAVLFVLADHANESAEVWCSLATIIRESGFSDGAVKSALRSLEELGAIESVGYRQRARLRRLVLPADPSTSARDAHVTSAPHAHVTSAGDAQVPPTWAPPGHDMGTTSAAHAHEPEPEPEPLSTVVSSSSPSPEEEETTNNDGHRTTDGDPFVASVFDDLTPEARQLAVELRELLLPRRRKPEHEELCDIADAAERAIRRGRPNAQLLAATAIDKRPRAFAKNIDAIVDQLDTQDRAARPGSRAAA